MSHTNTRPLLILLASRAGADRFIQTRERVRGDVLVPLKVEQLAGLDDVPLYVHPTLWEMPDAYRLAWYVSDRLRAAERLPRARKSRRKARGLPVN